MFTFLVKLMLVFYPTNALQCIFINQKITMLHLILFGFLVYNIIDIIIQRDIEY